MARQQENPERPQLKRGLLYQVTTHSGTFKGRYLGSTQYAEHQFDLRPEHGTTTVREAEIVEAVPLR